MISTWEGYGIVIALTLLYFFYRFIRTHEETEEIEEEYSFLKGKFE